MSENTGKYIVFSVGIENYGVSIMCVKEIIRYEKITSVKDSQKFLRGVINLRGKIVPIIDMRLKFGMEEKDYDDRTVFVIVDIAGATENYFVGMAVDAVQEVFDISYTDIEPPPEIGLTLQKHFLEGIAKVNSKMIMVLNVEKILSAKEDTLRSEKSA